ncbi:cellobiose phosphorylase [Nakamurella flavida]|uniref:Cellobiose phosphorylase n=1 Tax=Nakamurella flavida TaxID=363630 RepID=A0A939C6K3_9ACTN|nr:glucoamylase family protein [Nakamurella flavida]MBM9478184.1 cellobiose phosphorylase [Nakamurella flavida]MDP9778594.1 hypothetical protein [Nakamurella flavida]
MTGRPTTELTPDERDLLTRWARDTWRSLMAMTDPATGLPSDGIDADLDARSRSGYTSPTNIGGLLWSTALAGRLGFLAPDVCRSRLRRTLATVARLHRHAPSGMFVNWYGEADGAALTAMPDGEPIRPFLSSVDNGWLAVALMVVGRADPALAAPCREVLRDMDFGFFHDPAADLLRGGCWIDEPDGEAVRGRYRGDGPDVWFTPHHYATLNSESRIGSYVGLALGQLPAGHYAAMQRGSVTHRGTTLVPTFGGSMFEALMPELFVDETVWGPTSWGHNHPGTVAAQRDFGLLEAGYGSWGFSPAARPGGGYSEWGVEAISVLDGGYPSDLQRTTAAEAAERGWGDGVVTPHALALALAHDRPAALAALADLENRYGAYGPGGFHDAVAVGSGLRAERHLALDQSILLAALGNVLTGGQLRTWFADPTTELRLRPLMSAEVFPGAGHPDERTR